MLRDDIRGDRVPSSLQAAVRRLYGRNQYGESLFRLIWVPSRVEKSGGLWYDWPDHVPVAERNVGGRTTRRVLEMRTVPKYPQNQGWAIERWFPAAVYGTPEAWYRPLSEGGTVAVTELGSIASLGDYPTFGDYEMISPVFAQCPGVSLVCEMIDIWHRERIDLGVTASQRMAKRVQRSMAQQQKRKDEARKRSEEILRESNLAFWGPHIGYGGTRRPAIADVAERIGISAHPTI